MNNDLEHLKLLSIFHYVLSGMAALFACFPILHLILGIVFIVAPHVLDAQGGPPPAFVGWLLAIFAAGIIVLGWIMAICILLAGRFLAHHRRYYYCLVVAAIECIFMPFGTVLGVFTILVLMRPTVKELFERRARAI